MNASITQVKTTEDNPEVSQLFGEYAQWFSTMFKLTYGVNIEVKDIQEKLLRFGEFMPPGGRLLLCYSNEALAGIACMRDIGMETGEIKRMYVRPSFRRLGLGRALLNRLIDEANVIGYRWLRLDSARFMTEAHQLYRSLGFGEIAPYEGSEIVSEFPAEFHSAWIYMEKSLA